MNKNENEYEDILPFIEDYKDLLDSKKIKIQDFAYCKEFFDNHIGFLDTDHDIYFNLNKDHSLFTIKYHYNPNCENIVEKTGLDIKWLYIGYIGWGCGHSTELFVTKKETKFDVFNGIYMSENDTANKYFNIHPRNEKPLELSEYPNYKFIIRRHR